MKHPITWVVLADANFARILENTHPGEGLHQIPAGTFKSPEKNSWSDDEGRTQSNIRNARLRLDKHTEQAPETVQFARTLIRTLEKHHRCSHFDKLAISAPPQMLGLLRPMLSAELKGVLKCELNKEIARVPTDEVAKHFNGAMRF